ncbi:MAG TPA: hypothetical protein VGH94_15040, partial [Acidimicrobiales bacterium]
FPLFVVPDIGGPKIRLGVLWFAVAAGAAAWSRPALAVVMAVAAAAAADEVVRIHLGARRWAVVAAGALLPLGAVAGAAGLLTAAAGACVLLALVRMFSPGPGPAVDELGIGLLASLALGLAASAPVLVSGLGLAAGLTMVVLVCAYEVGDFVVGSGAWARWEGPMAGMVAVGVCAFAAWTLNVAPLGQDGVAWLAATIALLGPLGPPTGSVLLGSATVPGRYVRRLDTLLVAGPVAAYVVAHLIHTR